MSLTFREYQEKAAETAIYPQQAAFVYPVLGLCGETGELAEKVLAAVFPGGKPIGWQSSQVYLREIFLAIEAFVAAAKQLEIYKKELRDNLDTLPAGIPEEIAARVSRIQPEEIKPLLKELGDTQWYTAAICRDMGEQIEQIAQANLDKLAARKARGTLQGSGDNR